MINNIQEAYCSLEVSKLLKEKNCNVMCNWYYDSKKNAQLSYCSNNTLHSTVRVARPTHSLAIEWIRVNFGIHIWIASKDIDGKDVLYIGNARNIPVKKDSKGFIIDPLPYNPKSTPQQATEAALLFTLQNLIP